METLWRLIWALPLVLAVGVAAMLLLRRFVLPGHHQLPQQPKMSVRSSLTLSDKTSVHLLDVEGKGYLVVESSQQAAVHAIATPTHEMSRSPSGLVARWMRSQHETQPR